MALRPNTVSVTTAPATSSPKTSPMIVSPGSTALRATVWTSIHSSEAPLAVVTLTNPEAWTSVMERMRTWAIGADRGTATVRVGSTSASAGPGETTETSPSWKEKAWMSRIPSQNRGREMTRLGTEARTRRTQAKGATVGPEVAATAMTTAKTRAVRKPAAASTAVEGRAAAMIVDTAAPVWTE